MSQTSGRGNNCTNAKSDQTAFIWHLEYGLQEAVPTSHKLKGRLQEHEVREWLRENSTPYLCQQSRGKPGAIRLLMTSPASYHSRTKYPEGIFIDDGGGVINKPSPDALGLENETIQQLSQELNLPWSLSTLTGYSHALFVKFKHRNEIGIFGGEALFHNTKDRLTTCFFYSAFPVHLSQFQNLLPELLGQYYQPMVFPVAFLKLYNECIEGYGKIQELNIATLEEGIGQTDYYQYESNAAIKPRESIKSINGISYDLSRFDQFIDFECRLLDFLNNMSSTLGTQFRIPCGGKLSEALQFVSCVAMSHKQAAASYRQRVQAQNAVLYSLVSQAESRLNYQVATSTKQDSSDMRAIALLTMIFLPGTFVATFFSAGFVTFNAGSTSTTNKYQWVYWAITLPLTGFVVLIWKCWSRKQNKRARNLLRRIEADDPSDLLEADERRHD